MKGFYSPIDKLAAELPRTKGTGAEFMTELSKRPGYKPQEAQDRDLQTLMALPKMAREEFLAKLKSKPAPKLEETTLANSILRNPGLNVDPDSPPQYEEHTLPGGSNYREILLRMPHDEQRAKEFSDPASGHWDVPGVLAHVRAKDRLIPDTEGPHAVKVIGGGGTSTVKFKTPEEAQRFAEVKHQGGYKTEITPLNHKKLLHIEEIQSDWHQQGRDKGYATPEALQELRAAELRHQKLKQQLDQAKASAEYAEHSLGRKEPLFQQPDVRARFDATRIRHNNEIMDLMPQVLKAQAEVQDIGHKLNNVVPNAPFKKNWHELALKKMIHHAAEKGYHGIVITPGQEQADRYKLSKHIGMVSYHPEEQRFQAFKPNRETVINEKGATPERVAELIGKEAAERLMKAPKAGDHHYLEGENLNIGGEGMKGFYDKIVPSFLNQFGKKYGAQVGTMHTPIEAGIEPGWITKPAAPRNVALHHFPITPEMREDVTKHGVPLYAKGGEVEVRSTIKDETIQRKIPEMESAVKALQAGEISHKDYDKIVNKHKPVKPYTFVPQPASDEDAERAFMVNKKPQWRGHLKWPSGRKVGLRLDIPAYENHGVWVNSIHDEEGNGEDKLPTAYNSFSSVKNATFDAKPEKAVRVATGEQNKSPFARILGDLHHMTEDEAVEHMKKYLNHPDYAQVGMDPRRHGFFYDRKTMKPVTHSAHVVQIGPLVLAHKPKYGKRETYATGGDVKLKHERDANLAEFLKDSKVKDVLYRGGIGHPDMSEDFLKGKARPGYATFASTSPHVAGSYAHPDQDEVGAIAPIHIKAHTVHEFPVTTDKHGSRKFDKFAFDRQAQQLQPGHALVARKVFDMGPRASIKTDPNKLYSYPSDIYAWNEGTETKSAFSKAQGGSIKPVGYTKEKVTVSPSLDQMQYELISVKHSKKVK